MNPKKEKEKEDKDESSQYDDLIPRSMLPEKSVIPEWRQFGYGIEDEDTEYAKAERKKKQKKKEPKKMASGGYVRAADGCAVKGKTKGRMV